MEDLLKFIPLALYVIYKFFGESKKKEQKRNSTPKTNKRNNSEQTTPSLKDILQELVGDKTKTTPPVPKDLTYEELHEERKRERQYDLQSIQNKNVEVPTPTHYTKEKVAKLETLKVKLEEEAHDPIHFKLRDAIIAQTILKRPNY